jgi:hypothetical protein
MTAITQTLMSKMDDILLRSTENLVDLPGAILRWCL